MATQEDWLAKFAARGSAVRKLADERQPARLSGAAGAAAVERQRAARAERTREAGQADLFARQGDLADAWRAKLAGAAEAPKATRTPPPVPERSKAMGAASAARLRKVAEATAKEKGLTGSHPMATDRSMKTWTKTTGKGAVLTVAVDGTKTTATVDGKPIDFSIRYLDAPKTVGGKTVVAMVGAIGLTAAEHDALLSTMERPRPVVDAKYEHAKPYSREDAAFDRAFERKHTGE